MNFFPAEAGASNSIAGIWHWDVRENVVYGDPLMAMFFNFTDEEAAAGIPIARYLDAIHRDDIAPLNAQIDAALKGNSAFVAEYRVFGRDKICRRVIATGRCFYDKHGKPIHYPGMVAEVEQVLETALNSLDDLADHSLEAYKAAAADKRDFIVYLLKMVLHEVGIALASNATDAKSRR